MANQNRVCNWKSKYLWDVKTNLWTCEPKVSQIIMATNKKRRKWIINLKFWLSELFWVRLKRYIVEKNPKLSLFVVMSNVNNSDIAAHWLPALILIQILKHHVPWQLFYCDEWDVNQGFSRLCPYKGRSYRHYAMPWTRLFQKEIVFRFSNGRGGRGQGWRSGESTRLPPVWPEFDSQIRRYMWVEFVGCLIRSERLFSGSDSGFPLSSKTDIWVDIC